MRLKRIAGYYGVDAVPGFLGRTSDSGRTHFPELTGLRGVAILIVVIGHLLQRVERFYGRESLSEIEALVLGILATPFSGCRLLFCITGYTLMIYLNQNPSSDKIEISFSLIKNRLSRLWPPYFLILLLTLLFIALTGYRPSGTYQFYAEPESLMLSFLASIVYIHDLAFNTFPRLFPPGWFLEVHFQFLIMGPALWQFYKRVSGKSDKILITLGFLLTSIIISILASTYGSRGVQYSILTFFPYFLVGAMLAEFNAVGRSRRVDLILGRQWPVGSLGLLALITLGAPCGAIWWQLPAQLVAIAAVMTACLSGQSGFRRAMSDRVLTRIGIASFSIYLVHLQILQVTMPVIVDYYKNYSFFLISLICAAVGLCFVLALSLAFYWLVERPCVAFSLRSKRRSDGMARS